MPNLSRSRRWLLLLVLLGAALTLAALFLRPSVQPTAAGPAAVASAPVPAATGTTRPALTVTTTRPQTGSLPVRLAANGNVSAWQEASVGAELGGQRLAEVLVNVGDAVQRGQVLARFATEAVQSDVAQARAAVAEASASALEATANADRVRTLQHTGTFSGQQISQYLTAEQTARARVESVKAALASQLLRLQNTEVRAPDAGVVSARSATVGAVVGAGTELFRLIRQGRLEWRAEVTAAELGRIPAGTAVNVQAASGAQLRGRVRMVAPTVDPQTRTGLVYVDLPTPARDFKAGMFARGEFELGAAPALTVPQQAVVVRDGFSYVFRLHPDQRVSQLKVQTGRRQGERVEVLEGLDGQTLLVASGAGFLNDGDLVKVAPGSASNPASALVKPEVPATK
ncbi:MAG: efflux RND transporter periplasmic adaptor subunit [Rhodoferax sp.]|nr:efflux RND transporter periplasmic adaptor subunit [Rhodoferax sp.]